MATRLERNQDANPTEKHLLGFITEQYAVKVGQLRRFSGMSHVETERLVREWEDRGWIFAKRFITGDEVWVWLRAAGLRQAPTPFGPHYEVQYWCLAHWSGITEARLWLEDNYDVREWQSERYLRFKRAGPDGSLPDAAARIAVEKDGVTREHLIAIEVQLVNHTGPVLRQKVGDCPQRYAGVIYFAVPEVRRHFDRLGFVDEFPRLAVQEIEAVDRSLSNPAWRLPGDPTGVLVARQAFLDSLLEVEVKVLDLLAEQGAIPMDQLFRFLREIDDSMTEAKVAALISRLVRGRVVQRAKPLVDEPAWVWLTQGGGRASRHELSITPPKLNGLEFKRALNEVRLQITVGRSDVEWFSARVLRRKRGMEGSVPHAMVIRDGKRVAIEVFISPRPITRLSKKWSSRCREFDGVLWFYSRRSKSKVLKFMEQTKSPNLAVFPLPSTLLNSAPSPQGSRRRRNLSSSVEVGIETTIPVHLVSEEDLPSRCLEDISVRAGLDRPPKVEYLWQEGARGAKAKAYLVETDLGVFYLEREGATWDVTGVSDVLAFEKEVISLDMALAIARERKKAGLPVRHEIDGGIWAEAQELIPTPEMANPSWRNVSNQAVLSAMVLGLRTGIKWEALPAELGYGSGATVRRRIEKWASFESWQSLIELLKERLPDGTQLDWSRLTF